MARIHGIVVLAAIAAGTGLWFAMIRGGDDVAPPLPSTAPPADAGEGLDPPDQLRTGDPVRVAADRPTTTSGSTNPAAPADDPVVGAPTVATTDAPAANVELHVLHLVGRAPVDAFRWSYQRADGSPPLHGDGASGRAALALPAGTVGRLLVEAADLEAETRPLQVPGATAPPTRVDLALAPRAAASGVTLRARAPDGAPVTRLRLDVWRLQPGEEFAAATDDHDGEPMWSRVGGADDGAFALPTLAADSYALRAQPVDEDGAPLPLQPWRHRLAFAGHEAVALVAQFAAGVVLQVQVAPDGGAPVLVRAEVTDPARGVLPVAWRSVRDDATPTVGRSVVELPGRATTLLALPPGAYALRLELDGAALALQPDHAAGDPGRRAFTATLPR
ncbi:MAG: hypothetical protein AB7O84_16475 [Planctomycetota bacterium]